MRFVVSFFVINSNILSYNNFTAKFLCLKLNNEKIWILFESTEKYYSSDNVNKTYVFADWL